MIDRKVGVMGEFYPFRQVNLLEAGAGNAPGGGIITAKKVCGRYVHNAGNR